MKLKKLIRKFNGDYLQLKESKSGITTRVLSKYELRRDYWDNLERKVVYFEITRRCESNELVLWVEIL